jgi:hypothetical protein
MATVQDYLNLAVSGTLSNQAKTDVEFRLPDDIRRLTDMKVDAWSVKRVTVAAGATGQDFNVISSATSLFMVFFSHPVSFTKVENVATSFYASFFGVWSDRSDGTISMMLNNVDSIEVSNTLHSPNYVSTSGGSTTAVEATVLEIAFSSTA